MLENKKAPEVPEPSCFVALGKSSFDGHLDVGDDRVTPLQNSGIQLIT